MCAKARIFLIIFLLIVTGCTSVSQSGFSFKDLIPLTAVDTPEEAQKALIIFQEFRLSAMRVVKKSVELKLRPEEDLTKFDNYDQTIRNAWDAAYKAVQVWKLSNTNKEEFQRQYITLMQLAPEIEAMKVEAENVSN